MSNLIVSEPRVRARWTKGVNVKRNIALVALAAALLVVAWFWQGRLNHESPAHVQASSDVAPSVSTTADDVASAPTRHYPVAPAPATSAPAPRFEDAVAELFVGTGSLPLFKVDDLARRFVATVDNLGRDAAPASMWPVQPAPGRFGTKVSRDGDEVITSDNGLRYAPYVRMLEQLDLPKAMGYYKGLYPTLQRAYQDLGYPRGYFNDRFVEVLDQLLATPEVRAPQHVHRPVNRSGLNPSRPWLLYEFDDPALQALSAGQRILLRMGPDNERRVKARLAELRNLLVAK